MNNNSSVQNTLLCPNCGALNSPKALVCISCGVSLVDFRAALPRIHNLQDEQAAAHWEQLQDDASSAIAGEVTKGRKQLSLQLRVALIVAAALAILVVIGTAWYAHLQHLRQERLAAQYDVAVTCLENSDYLCARDGFEALLREEPYYDDAQDWLNEARYGLSRQYVRAGQWESAIAELDVLLKDKPSDERALTLLKETYDRWAQDALGQKDWLTMFWVIMQRDARFAPED